MRPFQDGGPRPGNRSYPCPCGYHPSDVWILVDTLVTIVASVATILVIILRHPFYVLTGYVLVVVLQTAMGWG